VGQAPAIEVEPWDRRRDRRTLVLLVLAVWAVYLATATYSSYQVNDNRAVNISAWSLGTRGTFALPEGWEGHNAWIVEGRDGALVTNRFPGPILWAAPFHAVGEALLQRGEPDHAVFLNYAPGGVAAATVTALAVGASFLLFRRLADRRMATVATLVLAFGTGVWSVSADAMWTHGLTHLTLVLGVLAMASQRYARAGVAFAFAVITRPHTAVIPAVVGVWEGVTRRSWRPVFVVGSFSALGVAALSAYSLLLFETWLPVSGYEADRVAAVASTGVVETFDRVINTMAHRTRGVFVYTPYLLILVPFIGRGWRASPAWVRSSAIAGLLYLAVQLRVHPWAGGSGYFGSRLTIETLVLAAPLLLRTWQAGIRDNGLLRRASLVLIVVALALHTVGATVRSIDPASREQWRQELETFCEANPELDGCA
jgi:hypothetical protein